MKMITKEVTKFDIADYLDDNAMIEEYLNEVLENGTTKEIVAALNRIARAKGMRQLAEKAGLSTSSVADSLTADAEPPFEVILKLLRAIGGNIRIGVS